MSQRRKAVEKELADFLSGPALQFVLTQLYNVTKKIGHRWTENDKSLALSIFHASPKVYRILRKIFLLPSVSTLQRVLRNVQVYPGFNNNILKALKQKVSSMPPNAELCCVVFDEMTIRETVTYNMERDFVEGLEDFGNSGRTKHVANHATVFMVQGLLTNWKQAVGYFLSSGSMDSKLLHSLLLECLDKLEETGLEVKVMIADQSSNNGRSFEQLCKVTEEEPFFFHKGRKIYMMYNPPRLLKDVCNNMKKHGFVVKGEEINWTYIEQFYNFDKQNAVRIAPELTAKHIDMPPSSALHVKYAAQVLSHSVAAGLSFLVTLQVLSPDATATALFIEKFDQLFNAFNSRNLRSSQRKGHGMTGTSGHVEFLQDTLDWLQSVQLPETARSSQLSCLTRWKMAIRSLLALWEELSNNYGVNILLTDRLNQDCVEDLFSTIRGKGGHGDNPSADQFRTVLRQAMVDSFLVHSHCKEDTDGCLPDFNSLIWSEEEDDPV